MVPLSDMILKEDLEFICLYVGNKFDCAQSFLFFTLFCSIVLYFTAPSPFTLICIVRVDSSNNEISGKGLRPVQCVLLDQAMSPLYLSSSRGGQTLHTRSNFRKKKKHFRPHYPALPFLLKTFVYLLFFLTSMIRSKVFWRHSWYIEWDSGTKWSASVWAAPC